MSKKSIIGMIGAMAMMDSMFSSGSKRFIEEDVKPLPPTITKSGKPTKSLDEYYTPPRSMTDKEKAYYDQHKNFNGFKS